MKLGFAAQISTHCELPRTILLFSKNKMAVLAQKSFFAITTLILFFRKNLLRHKLSTIQHKLVFGKIQNGGANFLDIPSTEATVFYIFQTGIDFNETKHPSPLYWSHRFFTFSKLEYILLNWNTCIPMKGSSPPPLLKPPFFTFCKLE